MRLYALFAMMCLLVPFTAAATPWSAVFSLGTGTALDANRNAAADGQTLANILNGRVMQSVNDRAVVGMISADYSVNRYFYADMSGFMSGADTLSGEGSGSGYSTTFAATDHIEGAVVLAVGRLPITPGFALYAGVGGAYTRDSESWTGTTAGYGQSAPSGGEASANVASGTYTVGLRQRLTQHLALDVSYLWIEKVGNQAATFTAGPFAMVTAGIVWRL